MYENAQKQTEVEYQETTCLTSTELHAAQRNIFTTRSGLLRNRQRAADREELEILRRDCNSIVIEALNQERERKNAALIKRRTSLSMRRKSMMAASSSGGGAAPGAPAKILPDIPILSPATSSKMALPPAPVASVDEDEDDYCALDPPGTPLHAHSEPPLLHALGRWSSLRTLRLLRCLRASP